MICIYRRIASKEVCDLIGSHKNVLFEGYAAEKIKLSLTLNCFYMVFIFIQAFSCVFDKFRHRLLRNQRIKCKINFIKVVIKTVFKMLYKVRDIKKMLMFYMSLIDNDDDRAKFEILYNKYRKRMVSIAFSVLKNKEDAEDAVHDTFIKIARNMQSIGEPDSSETLSYVLKATKNNAINLSQKNATRNKHIQLEDVENISDEQFLEKFHIRENYEEVVKAIRSLT